MRFSASEKSARSRTRRIAARASSQRWQPGRVWTRDGPHRSLEGGRAAGPRAGRGGARGRSARKRYSPASVFQRAGRAGGTRTRRAAGHSAVGWRQALLDGAPRVRAARGRAARQVDPRPSRERVRAVEQRARKARPNDLVAAARELKQPRTAGAGGAPRASAAFLRTRAWRAGGRLSRPLPRDRARRGRRRGRRQPPCRRPARVAARPRPGKRRVGFGVPSERRAPRGEQGGGSRRDRGRSRPPSGGRG